MQYRDLYNFKVVPEEAKIINEKFCVDHDANGTSYSGQVYTENEEYKFQLKTNANFSESQSIDICNNRKDVVDEINKKLEEHNIKWRIRGKYEYNEVDHDTIKDTFANKSDYTWSDLIRSSDNIYDPVAAWTIEDKCTKSISKNINSYGKSFHRADIVFVFYLDTKEIHVLSTNVMPRRARDDAKYIDCGVLATCKVEFSPITIEKGTWRILYQ